MRNRPYVLSIAGFDPCGGAGVLADIKTFEAYKTLGLGVSTAITYQTEDSFAGVDWLEEGQLFQQLKILLEKYPVKWVKVGLIENHEVLTEVISILKQHNPEAKIIWDPILKATAGFTFHKGIRQKELESIASGLFMITPNFDEIQLLFPDLSALEAGIYLSSFCKVFLKGGHNPSDPGRDFLLQNQRVQSYRPRNLSPYAKHGSGCVLSSALTAGLAKGFPLNKASLKAKRYVERLLNSNPTLLGYHKI